MEKAKSPQFWQYYAVVGALAAFNVLASGLMYLFTSANQLNDLLPPIRLCLGVNVAVLTLIDPAIVPGAWLGEFLFTRGLHLPWLAGVVYASGLALQSWLIAKLLRRFGLQPRLNRLHDVACLVLLGALFSTPLCALIGVSSLSGGGLLAWEQFGLHFGQWWLGDVLSLLLLTPVILTWASSQPIARPRLAPSDRRRVEIGLWLVLLFGLSWLVLTARSALPPQSASQGNLAVFPLEYLLFPLVVWSALRFGQRGTTLASLVICGIALWGLAEGESPFLVSMTDSAQAVLAMQAFVGVASVSGLFLAAAVAERQQAIAQLQDLTRTLDQQVIDRTRQLQESEIRARRLIDSNLIGVAFWDETGEIVEANRAFYELLGYSPAESLNWQAVLSQHASEAIATLQQATDQPIERDFCRADGSTLPVLVGSTRLDGTGVSFVLDLSERKRTQEALQESERRFRRLAESNIFGVAFGDFHGGIHYINDYLLTMLGCDRAELLDGERRWFDMTPSEYWPLDIQGGEELRRNGVCTPYEKEFIRKDGRRVPVLIGATLLQAPFDQQAEIIAFCVDLTPQKQAEAALRRTQAEVAALNQDLQRRVNELQALFEVIPIGIAIAQDADCRRIQVNSAFAQLLGISIYENASSTSYAGEMLPPFRVYWDGRELSGTELPLQQAAANGVEVRNVELDVVRRDGQVFNLYGYATPLLDEQKRPRGAVSAFVNITDRKRTEAKIAQLLLLEQAARNEAEAAQRQLANIFETSPVGLGFLDRDQRFVAINEALAEINGLSPEEHIGRSICEIFGESDPAMVELIEGIYATGKPFIAPNYAVNVPNRIDRRPGYYNVYYVPDILPNGDVENLLIYILDVTDRVRLEQRELFLANASTLLSTSLDYEATLDRIANVTVPEIADWCMVDTLEDGEMRRVAVAHGDPSCVEWAKQLWQQGAIDKQSTVGISHVLRTGQAELYTQIPESLLAIDCPAIELLRQIPVSSVMIVPLLVGGNPLGAITLVAAESERQYSAADLRLAEELVRRAAQAVENARLYRHAQDLNRVKDEFLATLSHELRSPLNGILGWAQLLRRGKVNDNTRDRAFETIERNAKAQVQLIDDLLDISRIIRGKLRLEMRPIELVPIVQTAIEAMRPAATVKDISIESHLEPSLVSGDPDRLQQVLWNLLSNAIKFTPNGGRVQVRLTRKAEGRLGGETVPPDACLLPSAFASLTVSDTGKGIHPDFLPHVFERFRQADSSITRAYGGLGLGLAIVRHMVELHGGTVQADSLGEGRGAAFTVRLPLLQDLQEMAIDSLSSSGEFISEELPLDEPPRLEGLRVLVVDDEPDARELVSTVLRSQGAEVAVACSVSEALEQIAQFEPQVLVSDVGMPLEDGYSLIRRVRSLPIACGGRIAAVALTAYAREEDRRRALMVGFQSHVAKPVNPTELVMVVASLAGRTGGS